jgi:hypothetical protein
MRRPDPDEYARALHAYVARVPDGDLLQHLERQAAATCALLAGAGEARAGYAYAPGKWPVRRVLQHVTDGERVFCYRALCIARGETESLPAFDENRYAPHDGTESRRLRDILDEFAAVRAASLALFRGFDAAAWQRRGRANEAPASVRSLAWIVAGHELHHVAVLRERYGLG